MPSALEPNKKKWAQLQQYSQRALAGVRASPSKSNSPIVCPRFSHLTGFRRGAKNPLPWSGQNILIFLSPFNEVLLISHVPLGCHSRRDPAIRPVLSGKRRGDVNLRRSRDVEHLADYENGERILKMRVPMPQTGCRRFQMGELSHSCRLNTSLQACL